MRIGGGGSVKGFWKEGEGLKGCAGSSCAVGLL